MSQRINLPQQQFTLQKGWCGQLCLNVWQVPGCSARIQRNCSVFAPAPRRLQRGHALTLPICWPADLAGWAGIPPGTERFCTAQVQGHVLEARTTLQRNRHVTKAHSQWLLQNCPLKKHRVDDSKVSILLFWRGILVSKIVIKQGEKPEW